MRSSVLWLPLVLGAVTACTPEIPEPIWEGEYLHFGTTARGAVCRGSFHRQEDHAVKLARLIGFELPEPIQFTRIRSRQVRKYCRRRAQGCAWRDEPYAFAIGSNFDFHEISHVVAHLAGLAGPLPFREGFAVVFDDSISPSAAPTPLAEVLGGEIDDHSDYRTAGRFVRFLIERHDLETFLDFMRSTPWEADFAAFAPIFAEVFGEPIEAAMADFADYPQCSSASDRIAVVDCDLPLEPWDAGTLTVTAPVACERDDVLGPYDYRLMLTSRGFEVEQAGSYRMSVSAPPGYTSVRVVKCGSCWDSLDEGLLPDVAATLELTPGRYYAEFHRVHDEPAEVRLVIERL